MPSSRASATRWEVTRNYFKMHSCCRFNHAALDALAKIEAKHPGAVKAEQIDRIEVDTYSLAVELDDPRPQNTLAGKFSLPFSLATTIANGSSGVASFTWDQVGREDIRALSERVVVREDPAMSAQLPAHRPAKVAITLNDGSRLEAATETNRGDWSDPYAESELCLKYMSLAERLWSRRGSAIVYDEVSKLDMQPSLDRLTDLMVQAVP